MCERTLRERKSENRIQGVNELKNGMTMLSINAQTKIERLKCIFKIQQQKQRKIYPRVSNLEGNERHYNLEIKQNSMHEKAR